VGCGPILFFGAYAALASNARLGVFVDWHAPTTDGWALSCDPEKRQRYASSTSSTALIGDP
jgi:hypothetical protein